jgi:hypothetical protein
MSWPHQLGGSAELNLAPWLPGLRYGMAEDMCLLSEK